MARVLLINPNYNYRTKTEMYPSGALLLFGSLLKKKGHIVKVIHMVSDQYTYPVFKEVLSGFHADITGITISTFQTRNTGEMVRDIQKITPQTKIIIGGPHPSAVGKDLEGYKEVKFVLGQGEDSILDLVEPGHKPFTLDDIPLPDLSLVNLKAYIGCPPYGPKPSMFSMFSRGCPFHCTYCNKAIFGDKLSYRDPEACLDEIEYLNKDWGIKELIIQDDTFNLNRKWCEYILMGIIKRGLNKKMVFRTPCRANSNLVDTDLLKLMKEAGIWLIFYGVESGNQLMLDRMKKSLTLEEIKRAFTLTNKVGIKTEASFIIGLPGETRGTFEDSLNFCSEIKPFWVGFSTLIPFPGTPVTQELKESGYLLNEDYGSYMPGEVMSRTDTLTKEDIEKCADKAHKVSRSLEIKNLVFNPKVGYRIFKELAR